MPCCGQPARSVAPGPKRRAPTRPGVAFQVTVHDATEEEDAIKAHPGMSVQRSVFGPATTVLLFSYAKPG